ncbi:MAG: hypothetical protein LBB88_01330 [Planctomycetaceae bacterium]|nr:hypothetical protein [Planctomycetaceae bacterium]
MLRLILAITNLFNVICVKLSNSAAHAQQSASFLFFVDLLDNKNRKLRRQNIRQLAVTR